MLTEDKYSASEFGGMERIVVRSPKAKNKNCVDVTVKVLGLSLLPVNYNYIKIDGTEDHPVPADYNEDHNHWGTRNIDKAILNLSLAWYNKFSNIPVLSINDMSLPFGGKFDINGMWDGDHKTHRIGNCVDTQSRLMLGERWKEKGKPNGWYDNGEEIINDDGDSILEPYQLGKFREILLDPDKEENIFSTVMLESPGVQNKEHWHLIK